MRWSNKCKAMCGILPAEGECAVNKVLPRYEWKEAGVRGIPSPFIKIYERGRDTPHTSLWRSTTA